MINIPKVYCIIVTYNGMKWIEKCVSTIKEEQIDLHILLIDNNSSDETVEFVQSKFPDVRVIPQSQNLGFGGANNLGYEIAKKENADYIYLLNQDTISYPNTIFNLIELDMKTGKENGFLSPIHLNDSGNSLDQIFESFINSDSTPNLISDLLLSKKKELYQIEFSNAAAWLLKMSTIKNVGGLFSKAFFHYGEDNNFVNRLKYFGYENFIAPQFFIHHCREIRKGKLSAEFQSKRYFISATVKMHDINYSYLENSLFIFKKSFSLLSKFSFKIGFKLLFYPILSFHDISKTRKSYFTKKIV